MLAALTGTDQFVRTYTQQLVHRMRMVRNKTCIFYQSLPKLYLRISALRAVDWKSFSFLHICQPSLHLARSSLPCLFSLPITQCHRARTPKRASQQREAAKVVRIHPVRDSYHRRTRIPDLRWRRLGYFTLCRLDRRTSRFRCARSSSIPVFYGSGQGDERGAARSEIA